MTVPGTCHRILVPQRLQNHRSTPQEFLVAFALLLELIGGAQRARRRQVVHRVITQDLVSSYFQAVQIQPHGLFNLSR